MVARASGIESVFVRVTASLLSSERDGGATSSGDDDLRPSPYHAWIYSKLSLPIQRPSDPELPLDIPAEVAGDPLAGSETFVVNWARYTDHASEYFEGAKEAWLMRERLFEALPPALSAILSGDFGGGGRTRTWFYSDAAEVNQLPWELVAYGGGRRLETGGSFVRGVPPETASPLVPVVKSLRLGVIDPLDRAAPAFRHALSSLGGSVEIVPLSGDIRRALQAAAEEGIELLHVVAAASVTPSLDGVLETPGSDDRPVASSEVAAILRGSRVRLVGLVPPVEDPASSRHGPYGMASAYRGFTYFATSSHPIPTFIVPVGPMDDRQVVAFWSLFYKALSSSMEIESALMEALQEQIVPVGLFLRQLQSATFRRVSETERPEVEPSLVNAQLEASQELLRQFHQVSSNIGFKSSNLKRLVKREQARHSKLREDVSPWIEGVDEE